MMTTDSFSRQTIGDHVPFRRWMKIGAISLLGLALLCFVVMLIHGVAIFMSGRILPGISTLGVSLGDLDVDAATIQIAMAKNNRQVTLTDGSQSWQIKAAQ